MASETTVRCDGCGREGRATDDSGLYGWWVLTAASDVVAIDLPESADLCPDCGRAALRGGGAGEGVRRDGDRVVWAMDAGTAESLAGSMRAWGMAAPGNVWEPDADALLAAALEDRGASPDPTVPDDPEGPDAEHLSRANARVAELEAERDRFREHSVVLNTVGYRIAQTLGKANPPADYHGDVMADLDELLALFHLRWDLPAVDVLEGLADDLAGAIGDADVDNLVRRACQVRDALRSEVRHLRGETPGFLVTGPVPPPPRRAGLAVPERGRFPWSPRRVAARMWGLLRGHP